MAIVRGAVDAAGGGFVTIVVESNTKEYPPVGCVCILTFPDRAELNGHVHDWRFYARRPDGLADIICVAEGCRPNEQMRVAPRIASNSLLPKYEGQFDV